ncbi:MAG: hypothetical protein ABIH92_05190 [Nanoarchaeota archaeon]
MVVRASRRDLKLVGVDVDEVLVNLMDPLLLWYNRRYGTGYRREDIWTYNLWEVWGIPKGEDVQRVNDFWGTQESRDIPPIQPARTWGLKMAQGFDLVAITSRPKIIEEETRRWIQKYFPSMFSGVHLTGQYSVEGSNVTKGDVCRDLGVDLMVEDCLGHARDIREKSPGTRVLLYDNEGTCLWNQLEGGEELPEGVERVHTWGEIPGKVRRILG